MAVNQPVDNPDMEEEQQYTVGMLYGYNIASYDRNGQCKYKVGMSEQLDNSRINGEMSETLSEGKVAIMKENNNNIPLCFIHVPNNMKLKDLESELFVTLQYIGGVRPNPGKELFVNITIENIIGCMNFMIDKYGGTMSNYRDNEIKYDYLTEPYDEFYIVKGHKYEKRMQFHKNRADQFIGKQIREIRNNINTYMYGGSRNNPRNCEPRDFKYLIDGQVIDVVKQ